MTSTIADGGLQFVPQIAAVQYVYLDFDGELTSYNGEILTVDQVEVRDPSLTEERIADIVAELNAKYADKNVIFVTEKPENTEYSTIYIGKTEAFSPYGNFAGLAETIDSGNKNKSDNAFVMLDSTFTDAEIISTISHETDHLLGTLTHEGEGLDVYAHLYYYNRTYTGILSNVLHLSRNSVDYLYETSCCTFESKYYYVYAENVIINPFWGTLYVADGGRANNTTVNSTGVLAIFEDGIASNTIINSSGTMQVSDKGVAIDTNINSGGYVVLFSGGIANNTIINSGGYMYIEDGDSVANSVTVNTGGRMLISSGTATHVIENGGCVDISRGNVTFDANIVSGLHLYKTAMTVHSNTVANDTTVGYGAEMSVFSSGIANNVTVGYHGKIYIDEDATVTNIVENGGYVYICEGANVTFVSNTINNVELTCVPSFYAPCVMTVHSNTVANYTTINSSGYLVLFGGKANYTTINSSGNMYICSGGVANCVEINSYGDLNIRSGGIANNNNIHSHGAMYVSKGGMASGITIDPYGSMYVSSGGTVTGKIYVALEDTTVKLFAGSTIDFNIQNQTPQDDALFINYNACFRRMHSTIITVTSDQESGIYKLATNASYFDKSDAVTIKDSNKVYGSIYANGRSVTYNGVSYILTNIEGDLCLTVVNNRRLPDLTVSCSVSQEEVVEGEFFNVTITVSNNGQEKAAASDVRLHQGINILNNYDIPELEAGKSYTITDTYVAKELPEGLDISEAILTAVVDGGNSIEESNEDNNTSSDTIKVLSKPDLLISEITFDREEFYVGEECRCYFTVVNNGGSDAENFAVSFKINGVEYASGTIESLAAKASSTFYVDIAGEDLIKGESTVTVVADSLHNVKESDESNNSLSVPFTVKDLPDLVITECKFFPDLIGKGPSAQSTLQISFANQGKEASDPCTLGIYCGDKLITTVNVGALAIGENRSVSKNIQLFDWEDGRYYFTAKIDSEDKIKESNEFNNSLVAQIDIDLPDLVISDFSVDNVIVKNGHTMLRFEVSNQGAVGAEDSETYLYIGEGADPIVFDTPYLPPGGKYIHWRSISSFAKDPGSYKITMIADGSKLREETWETNNSASTYIIIKEKTIPPSGGENKAPDLTVTFLEQQEQLKQNEAEFIFSVSNIGKEDADASVLYVFVDDSKIREINISALKADEAFSGTFSLSTATWSTGTHKLTVKADGKETISESDEDNNEKSLFFTIPDEQTPGPAAPGGYIFHYSQNTFMNYLQVETQTPTVDLQGLPAGIYQWRHKQKTATQWQTRADITSENTPDPAEILSPEANGNFDLFFAEKGDVWSDQFVVQHTGILSIWQGTGEQVLLAGKNKFSDVFFGSGDANILVLTDDDNGDALFVDDIYSALGTQARLSKINEIRAGFGDDIIDLTSQRYAYTGEKMTVYGGSGNDTIWANADKNTLYGDAGNDRIVGACGNDLIIGGAGDDTLHGGGGTDTFCFGANWGNDTVEQLANGEVILHFESDSGSWDESTLTYSDGTNSIRVCGVVRENITLKFGGTSPVAGAFLDAASEKIFEDKNSGMIA